MPGTGTAARPADPEKEQLQRRVEQLEQQVLALKAGASLFQGRNLVPCRNVTITANHKIPQVGVVVEVCCLYNYLRRHRANAPAAKRSWHTVLA
ncbi:MAG: hypothetical protein ABSE48_22305 [Verrucomicrobiota bacterium]